AILRGGGQIYGRCPPRLGVHRTPVYPGARRKGPMLWRHHPTASGRACPRVADRGLADGPRDGRHRAGAATLPAGNRLISLLFSFLPSCQGAKTPLRHPWASCAYATVGKAASMSDFRKCPVTFYSLVTMHAKSTASANPSTVWGMPSSCAHSGILVLCRLTSRLCRRSS